MLYPCGDTGKGKDNLHDLLPPSMAKTRSPVKIKSHKASGTTSPPGELPDALWLSRGNFLNTAQAPRSTPEVLQATTASRLDSHRLLKAPPSIDEKLKDERLDPEPLGQEVVERPSDGDAERISTAPAFDTSLNSTTAAL